MRLSFVGLGHVGLSLASCFASKGHKVIGVDLDADKVELINSGKLPIYEPGLQELLAKVVEDRFLRCTTDTKDAAMDSDITFVTVGTPSLRSGSADLRSVKAAATDIGRALREKSSYHLTVISSTVTPGTTEYVVRPILENASRKNLGGELGLCMNPEFMREGRAVEDVFHPHLVVIGECDKRSGDELKRLYETFFSEKVPTMRVNASTAELIKCANNAFLATKISFANTIANICERTPNVDIVEVARAIGADPRIGRNYLGAGVGWGGSCLPKDLRALTAFAQVLGYRGSLLGAVLEVNENQCRRVYELARRALGTLKGKRISILGLAFKPGTDDIRDAPSIKLIKRFVKAQSEIKAYDPVAMKNARKILHGISYPDSAIESIEQADCCIVATDWDEFRKADL